MKEQSTYSILEVRYRNIIKAIECIESSHEAFYEAKVVNIKLFDDYVLLVIKKKGSYPLAENEWKSFQKN